MTNTEKKIKIIDRAIEAYRDMRDRAQEDIDALEAEKLKLQPGVEIEEGAAYTWDDLVSEIDRMVEDCLPPTDVVAAVVRGADTAIAALHKAGILALTALDTLDKEKLTTYEISDIATAHYHLKTVLGVALPSFGMEIEEGNDT